MNPRSAILIPLLVTLLLATTAQAQDPCAQLDTLRADVKQKHDRVLASLDDVAKAKAVKLPPTPPGDRTQLSSAAAAFDHVNSSNAELARFDQSDDGKRLIALTTEKTTREATVKTGNAAEQTARARDPQLTSRYDQSEIDLTDAEGRLAAMKAANARPQIIQAREEAVTKAKALRDQLRAEIYDATTLQQMADRDAAMSDLKPIVPEFDQLSAKRKPYVDVRDRALNELRPFSNLGTEQQVRAQLKALDDHDAAVGNVQGDIHQKEWTLKADQDALQAARDAADSLETTLRTRAQAEADAAAADAYLTTVDSKLVEKRDQMKTRVTNDIVYRIQQEQKSNPELWTPMANAQARSKHWDEVQRREIAAEYAKLVEAEAARLEGVSTRHLHLPCMDEQKEIREKIREKVDFLRKPKGTDLTGMENPIGPIPPLKIDPIDDKQATAAEGAFVLVNKELGKSASPGDASDFTVTGQMSEGSYTLTFRGKAPREMAMDFAMKWSTPPATLKPGDVIELTSNVSAKSVGKDFGYIGVGANWHAEGAAEYLEHKKTFAGYASDGKFYPSSEGKLKLKIGKGNQAGAKIKLIAAYGGFHWGNDGKWNPCEYTYEWKPAAAEEKK